MEKPQASPQFKREVIRRLQRARTMGASVGLLADTCGDNVSIHTIYDVLEAKRFPLEIWEEVSKGLERLGY